MWHWHDKRMCLICYLVFNYCDYICMCFILDNFTRIQSAFKYGARILGQILLLPRESILGEIKKFFECTLTRYGRSGAKLESLPPLSPSEKDVHLNSIDDDHFDDLMLDLEGKVTSINIILQEQFLYI